MKPSTAARFDHLSMYGSNSFGVLHSNGRDMMSGPRRMVQQP
jgi:hypothetical protein